MPFDVLRKERIWEVVRLFEWCVAEGLHPRVNTKDGRVGICSGGYVYEREEEASARTDKFLERAGVWTPFTTELYALNETQEGRSILVEAYSIYQEEA